MVYQGAYIDRSVLVRPLTEAIATQLIGRMSRCRRAVATGAQ